MKYNFLAPPAAKEKENSEAQKTSTRAALRCSVFHAAIRTVLISGRYHAREPVNMADRLSGVAIIICIGLGTLMLLLLFIFAKRQIMRFTLKSKHSPHFPIGYCVSKSLHDEVDRRLLIIKDIAYEPVLLKQQEKELFADGNSLSHVRPPHLLRMKAIDSLALLEADLQAADKTRIRRPGQDVRVFLLRQLHDGPLAGCDPRKVHRFLDLYEHARHSPKDFGEEQYLAYMHILEELRSCLPRSVNAASLNGPKRHIPRTPVPRGPEASAELSPGVNFVLSASSEASANGVAAAAEPATGCRPTSLAFAEGEEKNRDAAALETSV